MQATEPTGGGEAGTPSTSTHRFQADVHRVLSLVINSLYSNKEVFLRELLSNASDALDKLRFRAITEPELLNGDEALKARIIPDREARTLMLWDNGIGMSAQQLAEDLGTVARSGTRELLDQLEEKSKRGDLSLIGQFGVGFYSAFLVADHVEVVSLAAGERQAHRWKSDGKETFTIEPARRETHGTSVILHLREEYASFLEPPQLRQLVHRYSDYLGYPIELVTGDDHSETVNTGQALWQRAPSDVSKEQYEEFYKHLAHDIDLPLAWRHFRIEGTQEFVGLLFIPKSPPFDLYLPDTQHGVRLHVKRVFVMDDCGELLPKWLRFVRGVVDSEDLPLNVSRETLQDSRVVRIIRKQVVRQVLDLLEELAKDRPDDYAAFWRSYGAVLKEGLHFEPEHQERLAHLVRYESSRNEGLVSLSQYKDRMLEGQKAIYYALGESRARIEASPHLEVLRKKGYEVLYMSDAVDQWAVSGLREADGVPLISANDADLKLEEGTEGPPGREREEQQEALKPLLDRIRVRLQDHVGEVRLSDRLTDSPVCLVVPEGGVQPWIERLLRATQQDVPQQKRILEVNPSHTLIENLRKLHERNREHDKVDDWIEMLFDQALLAEGSPVEDPTRFARRLTTLLEEASELAARPSDTEKPGSG